MWVAYQPKLDLSTRRIIGAEALARWTHPEKGPIAASEFVAAAEQHDRIGKLTDFVLEKAIVAAAGVNRKQPATSTSRSTFRRRLLTDQGFALRLSALLARHGLPPHLLTLELTETAALAGSGDGARHARLAFATSASGISIDDYGTGLSTLEYLKKIPGERDQDRPELRQGDARQPQRPVMVQSTIGLAHSLGRKVVAEGVEHHERPRRAGRDGLRRRSGLHHRPADEPRQPVQAPFDRPHAQASPKSSK